MKKIISNEYLLVASRLFLGFLFVFSGIEKIIELQTFSTSIANYKLLPNFTINFFAIILPWIELSAGLLLIFGICVKENAAIINLLLVVFIVAVGISMMRGLDIDCGCFGTAGGQQVGFQKIGENVLLLLIGTQLIFFGSSKFSINGIFKNQTQAGKIPT